MFKNFDHEHKFNDLLSDYGERVRKSMDYRTILFVAGADERMKDVIIPYIDQASGDFDIENMYDNESLSSGEKTLIDVTVHLFNGSVDVPINDMIRHLDQDYFDIAIRAIEYRKKGKSLNKYPEGGDKSNIMY